MSVASRAILSNFFGEQGRQNHPQYLSGLSGALFPTTFLETAVYSSIEVLLMNFISLKRINLQELIFDQSALTLAAHEVNQKFSHFLGYEIYRTENQKAFFIQAKLSKVWKQRQMVQKFPGKVSRNSGRF